MNEQGSVCGVICAGGRPVDGDPRYISYGAMIWPALGIEMNIARSEEAKPEPTLLYDLLKSGYVAADESFSLVGVSTHENGTRVVSIRSDHEVQ